MITLELRAADAEPILREAAEHAAMYGAWCDHFTRRTVNAPFGSDNFDDRKRLWQERFLRAKRIVAAFGIEYEQTSEEETLTVYVPDKVLKSHIVKAGGIAFRHIDKSVPDPKNAQPAYRKEVHREACRAAADRVVRRWLAVQAGASRCAEVIRAEVA
jgi:hypothetical protein